MNKGTLTFPAKLQIAVLYLTLQRKLKCSEYNQSWVFSLVSSYLNLYFNIFHYISKRRHDCCWKKIVRPKTGIVCYPPSTPEMFSSEPAGCHLLNPKWWTVSFFILYQKQLGSGCKLILERMLSDNPCRFPVKKIYLFEGIFNLGLNLLVPF